MDNSKIRHYAREACAAARPESAVEVRVISLPAAPARIAPGAADYTDRAGAERLKAQIEAYWRERGCEVQITLVPGGFTTALRTARYDVRSDLLNGKPRRDSKACFA